LGFLFRRNIFKTKRTFYLPSTAQISLARFLPGARTVTFLASGFEGFPLTKFLLIIFPSSIIWTLLLLSFTTQILSALHFFPLWLNIVVGITLLVFVSKLRTIMKIAGMSLLVATLISHHFFIRGPEKRKKISLSLSRYCRVALKILDVTVEKAFDQKEVSGKLVLSNHMSYLDIICLSSIYPTLYVTSVEIRETPVLGLICELCGCLFTERRASKRIPEGLKIELQEIQGVLESGHSLTIFPEGTSSNGESLLPFKTPLLEAAFRAKTLVSPVILSYVEIAEAKFSALNRDVVCWYGSMGFVSHFLRLCDSRNIKVRLALLPDLDPKSFSDRKELGAMAHQVMHSRLLVPDVTFIPSPTNS
jgi:1-acyl-sn-glycerol-3-phosphate acyltransferase